MKLLMALLFQVLATSVAFAEYPPCLPAVDVSSAPFRDKEHWGTAEQYAGEIGAHLSLHGAMGVSICMQSSFKVVLLEYSVIHRPDGSSSGKTMKVPLVFHD